MDSFQQTGVGSTQETSVSQTVFHLSTAPIVTTGFRKKIDARLRVRSRGLKRQASLRLFKQRVAGWRVRICVVVDALYDVSSYAFRKLILTGFAVVGFIHACRYLLSRI